MADTMVVISFGDSFPLNSLRDYSKPPHTVVETARTLAPGSQVPRYDMHVRVEPCLYSAVEGVLHGTRNQHHASTVR